MSLDASGKDGFLTQSDNRICHHWRVNVDEGVDVRTTSEVGDMPDLVGCWVSTF